MKNITTVESGIYKALRIYMMDGFDGDRLVDNLRVILSGKGKKAYWFRFSPDDTLVNDWMSVRQAFGSYKNTTFLNECIESALENKSLVVFYS